MIEKAAVAGHSRRCASLRRARKKPQRAERALPRLRPRDPAALRADRIGVESEPDRRDRTEALRRPAVWDEPGPRVGYVPEPAERSPFQVVEQSAATRRASPTRSVRTG